MKRGAGGWVCASVALLLGLVPLSFGAAEPAGSFQYDAVMKDLMKVDSGAGTMTVVWWMPQEFWRAALAQNPRVTKEGAEEFVALFATCTVVAVVDGRIGPAGGITFKSADDVRGSTFVVDRDGKTYAPIAEDAVGEDLKSFLDQMKPVMANAIGRMGQSLHFLVFPVKDAKGRTFGEPLKEGTFVVKLDQREYRWKLPLGSLLPPKVCPKCKEQCSGAWKFCPWCGAALPKTVEPAEPAPPAPKKPSPAPAKSGPSAPASRT